MNQSNDDDKTRTYRILKPGTDVGHYRIVEKIGAGGMGEVFLAEDTKLKRKVALKFLPSHLMANAEVKSRFVREAQTVAQLNHPNVVSIYDVSEIEGRPYFVMELVEGDSLHHFAHDKPLPIDMIVEYAIQICQGLGEAHRAGIIHRDIKAANISVDKNNRIRLLDFGLAAIAGEDKITKTGSTLGTVSYMSPEQVSGRDLDHRSDLFSLGTVLYELIAGRTPFKRDSEGATLKAIIEDAPEPLTRYRSNVPEKLQEIVFELLEKDKEIRYQSAEGVIADLKRLTYDSQQTSVSRTSIPTQEKNSSKGMIIGISVAAAVVIAVIGFVFLMPKEKAQIQAHEVPMIAVLPFENLGAGDDEYFADGMTDEITSRLAGIKGLGVISRTSSMKFKNFDKSIQQIGEDLNADYILSGTVRWSKSGDKARVKISPQLVRTSADAQILWADSYERDLMQVFEVQADIAEKIVGQLGVTLVESDRATLADRPTENAEAYQLYLRALNSYRNSDRTQEYGPKDDIDSVVKLDPKFALAHALRSEIYSQLAFGAPHSEFADTAIKSAERALELHPNLPQGHLALGTFYNIVETDYDRALDEFSMAKSELHNDAELLNSVAFVYMRQGRFEEAQETGRKALALDPLNPIRYSMLASGLAFTRDFNEAEQVMRSAIAFKPDRAGFYNQLIYMMLEHDGNIGKAAEVFNEALRRCDTLEVAQVSPLFRHNYKDFPWDSITAKQAQQIKDTAKTDTSYFFHTYLLYKRANDEDKLKAYADSLIPYAEDYILKTPENPFINGEFGILHAVLGKCEKAETYGKKGKELMTVDDCHY